MGCIRRHRYRSPRTIFGVIDPEGLLRHAEQLADTGRGRPTEVALRRGISAAYYAFFHDLTWHAASHLVGSCELEIQNEIRRSWSHSEISQLAEQERRHAADYDHGERFAKSHLVQACRNARIARRRLREASSAAREALFTLLTVRRADFRQR